MEFSCNGTKLIEILGRPGVEAEETNGRRYSFFVVWASNLRGGHYWDLTLINNVYSCKPASNGILHGGKAVDAKKRELKTSLSWTQLLDCSTGPSTESASNWSLTFPCLFWMWLHLLYLIALKFCLQVDFMHFIFNIYWVPVIVQWARDTELYLSLLTTITVQHVLHKLCLQCWRVLRRKRLRSSKGAKEDSWSETVNWAEYNIFAYFPSPFPHASHLPDS